MQVYQVISPYTSKLDNVLELYTGTTLCSLLSILCHLSLSALACALLLQLKSKLVESDDYFVLWLHACDDVSLFPLTG